MIPWWPRRILPPRKATPEPVYATVGAGRSITAVEQISSSDAGYWAIDLDEVPVVSPLQKLTARGLSAELQGRRNGVHVPIYDHDNAPWPVVDGVQQREALSTFDDGATFSDGSQFEQPAIVASAVWAVSLGKVQFTIAIPVGSELRKGMHFSVEGATQYRLYRIECIVSEMTTGYVVKVWPPVREAVAAGASLNFHDPHLTCRQKTDAELAIPDDYAGRTLAKVQFEEMLP